ncbi:hypothetical protein ZIOFF_071944 [Zingiber officinale]|uniref:Uncharacterized protein n=1 Tax=Zingiber officinale TaxID=94328 RepID=A0A8J5EUN2_ZINOF|nr:hypothetical protein ZIOFF_071944 [Zingiber officinale]
MDRWSDVGSLSASDRSSLVYCVSSTDERSKTLTSIPYLLTPSAERQAHAVGGYSSDTARVLVEARPMLSSSLPLGLLLYLYRWDVHCHLIETLDGCEEDSTLHPICVLVIPILDSLMLEAAPAGDSGGGRGRRRQRPLEEVAAVVRVWVFREGVSDIGPLTLNFRHTILCLTMSPRDSCSVASGARLIAESKIRRCGRSSASETFLPSIGEGHCVQGLLSVNIMSAKENLRRRAQLSTTPAAIDGRRVGGGGPAGCCPSYAAERHGLWVLKGFAPVPAMARYGGSTSTGGQSLEAKDSVLRYALAHQQLEAVVQLEYTVCLRDPRFIRVSVRVDNVRLHVVRLRFGRRKDEVGKEEQEVDAELHFPSRARVWVGPELGASYATGPSLGRSSGNPERELEAARTLKGRFGGGKAAGVKATARTATRARGRSWRWEQEAEGGVGVFEGVLCDGATGAEVAEWRPGGGGGDPRGGMRRRYSGWGRAFSKGGGVVVAGDELAEAVEWRVGREMEGRVVRWRVGGRVWVSYFANEMKTGYYDTRSVEWREEVELAFLLVNVIPPTNFKKLLS